MGHLGALEQAILGLTLRGLAALVCSSQSDLAGVVEVAQVPLLFESLSLWCVHDLGQGSQAFCFLDVVVSDQTIALEREQEQVKDGNKDTRISRAACSVADQERWVV